MPLRVIKLGGSLLEWPELSVRFHRWLMVQTPAVNVLVAGGGPIVDGLRTIDRAQRVSTTVSHWLAIGAMSLTARLLVELLPEALLVDTFEAIDKTTVGHLYVLDVLPLLRTEQEKDQGLPESWDVTSDSIAAHVVRGLGAFELVLLKSTNPPTSPDLQVWAASGFVDAYFPQIAAGLAVRYVNLRDLEV